MEDTVKILHILHESPLDPRGGLGMHVAGLAGAQVAHGEEVTVLGMAQSAHGGLFTVDAVGRPEQVSSSMWRGPYRVCHAYNLNRHLEPKGSFNDLVSVENYTASILNADRDLRVDVVHLHDTYLAPVAIAMAAWQHCPLVVTSHLSCTLMGIGSTEDRYYNWCCEREMQTYHSATKLLTVSTPYAERLRDAFLLGDIESIPNGVDAAGLGRIGSMFRPREKVAAFVGRLVRQKGVDEIMKAAARMPGWRFVLVASIVPEQIDQHPLARATMPANVEWIRDAGYRLDRWQHVREASVALVPSIHEPFGIVALEWMALGVPLMTSRVDGLGEFCDDANSWYCEPTAQGIVDALSAFQRDEHRVENARLTAAGYSWTVAARKTLEAYHACKTNIMAA